MQSVIEGRKGGSSNARTPVESPDSIQSTSYAKILLALGEGEFKGGLNGTRIFLDGTPITDASGNANFSGVTWEFRAGTPDQPYIPGFPGVENEITVSTELTRQTAWVRSLTNTQLSAVRMRFSWSALQQQYDNGDVGGYRVEYAIDVATDGGSYQELLKTAVDGKTTTKYERSHRVDLPTDNTGWQIRVRRITPNSASNRIADRMVIEAITEVIDAKLRYPETALLFVQFDAKQFQNIPAVSCDPDGRIIRIPSNYDPAARSYSGTWDGVFKWAWTDNPAWIYYDIQISERFGLGNRIKAENLALTKWDLYRIAQYCDQPVPDGRGGSGTEPRFLCDVYIQSQEEAWTVLNDLAAIFRGSTFWANNQMNVIADMPRDIDYIVTRANVNDGKFTYSNASEKTHYSTAMVSWSDPANNYQDAIESVSDNKLVMRYGIKQADVTAIGCVRQTEAIRRGKWILHTNDADRAISYTMGLDGDIPVPGSIVGVADALLAGRPLGGRISAVDGRNVTLDRVSSAAIGERLIINLPSGKAQGRTIESVNDKIVTVTTEYSEAPIPESVWAVDATDLALQLYRVIGVAEGDDGVSFDITGIQYDPAKWTKIDTGARIESRPISVIPPSVQPAPANVAISNYNAVEQGINITTLRVTWDRADSAIAYEAQWRRDNGNWINAPRTSALGFEVSGIYAGQYQARVRAINVSEISSMWANAQETTLNGKEGNPPALASFATTPLVFGIQLDWAFPADTADTLKTEIQYSPTSDGQNALLLADVAYPTRSYQQMGLSIGQEFFYQARIVDKSGNQGPWTDWIRGESSTDVSDITDVIVKEVTDTDAWKSLIGDIENNSQQIAEQADQIADGMRDSIEQAKAIIRNSLANDSETRRWRAQNGARTAEITETRAVIANEVEARTIAMLEMQSSIGTTNSNLNALQQTVTTLEQTTAQDIASLNSKMTEAESGIEGNSAAIDGIETKVTQQGDTLTSQGSQITQMTAAINGVSGVANDAQSKSNANATALQQTNVTVAQHGNMLTAQATQISQMTITVNGVSAEISDVSSVVNGMDAKMSAYRSIKVAVDANGRQYIAGIGLDVSNSQDGMQANIIMLADRFTMMTTAGGVPTPVFTTQGTQVILRDAVIGEASIGGIKIKDNSLDFAKITDSLQSDNYQQGLQGWKIPKNGNAEFNNITVRGKGYFTDGEFRGTVYVEDLEGDIVKPIVHNIGTTTIIQAVPFERTIFSSPVVLIWNTGSGNVWVNFNDQNVMNAYANPWNNNKIAQGIIPANTELKITSGRGGDGTPATLVFTIMKS
ncbi:phage tail protein [Pectobacterium odoriferum]|uniref:TipJ family phage tail tip protein n=1 Tax=Pectobacterium odoriferum TaxID=78398 RepID=UPI00192E5596|nr:phage tail protein [Pectobacterium odoriferum]